MEAFVEFFNFPVQCCDTEAYLRLGQTCAETGVCYDKLRPVGSILWFSIPYRLGLPPEVVLISLRLLLTFVSVALSVFVSLKLIRHRVPARYKNIHLVPFITISSIISHTVFLQPVLQTALSDTAASLLAMIAVWLLLLISPDKRSRFVMLALAGLCMGLAAWIRVFFLYPVLVALIIWLIMWIFNSKRHIADFLICTALIPIAIQFYSTWKHTGAFSYIDPEVTANLLKEHRDNKSIGYDMVLDSRGIWNWYSRCENYQPLLPALEQADFHSLYCILSGRVNFYLGSYSADNFVNLGGYEVLWGRNLLKNWNDCNKDNTYIWTMTNLHRQENVAVAPDNTNTAHRLTKPDITTTGEIYQTITLRTRPVPYVFSTWLWGEENLGLSPASVKMLIRNHNNGKVIAEQDIPLTAEKEVKSLKSMISESGTYDFVIQSPPSTATFYLWEQFDLRLPEPATEGMASNIRTWSVFILIANSVAFALSMALIYVNRHRLSYYQIMACLFGSLLFGQAILSLPEQRFAIAPMITAWIFCISWVVMWLTGKITWQKKPTPLAQLRRDYSSEGLRRNALADKPTAQFTQWFSQAQEAQLLDPNAMVVASVGADGQPSARNVLLKAYDDSGFVFYTNLESHKAEQIAGNNKVALLFSWLPLNRQVKIEGVAEKLSTADALAYFLSRPKDSQYAAWASPQSQKISSRQILEEKFFEMKEKFAKGEVPLPSFWGGYRVVAHKIEFWQGRENRLHDRFVYTRQADGSWTIERLAP